MTLVELGFDCLYTSRGAGDYDAFGHAKGCDVALVGRNEGGVQRVDKKTGLSTVTSWPDVSWRADANRFYYLYGIGIADRHEEKDGSSRSRIGLPISFLQAFVHDSILCR